MGNWVDDPAIWSLRAARSFSHVVQASVVTARGGGYDHQERMLQLLNSVEGRLLSQDPEMVNGDQDLR
ncbi:3-oxoacyl- reductase [Apiospora arundinis]